MATEINISTAQAEYYKRPADERFPSVEALATHAQHEKELSAEVTYNAKDLRVVDVDGRAMLQSPRTIGKFTHWSFSQLCRSVGAPAGYLRTLPAENIAKDLNWGLKNTPPASDLKMLVRRPNGEPQPTIRACTTETYGRLWDADYLNAIRRELMQHDDSWQLPPTWDGKPAGANRGDRDSFLILTNGGSIVTDPTLSLPGTGARQAALGKPASDAPSDGMYRGILIRNSEVGACSVTIDTILYRYICGNHMIWGAIYDKRFKRRHVGKNVTREVIREISRIAMNWARQTPERDYQIIKSLVDHELAHTKEAVIDELRALGCSIEDATNAYDSAERFESASPRSFWGIAQGLTRISQETEYQDDRYILDQLAAKVLAKGAKQLVAV